MGFVSFLRRMSTVVQNSQNTLFKRDVEKQKRYIASLREPADDIDRGFLQYKCQMHLMGIISVFLNIISFFASLYYLLRLKECKYDPEGCRAVFLSNGIPENVIPAVLVSEFSDIKTENNDDFMGLTAEDKKFIKTIIKRYKLSWHFIFKCILKTAMYSPRVNSGGIKAVISCSEYSFTSSVMSAYCENFGVQNINVMHGEKFYHIRDSFFHYHRCYIWGDFYKDLFIRMRAEPSQFITEIPRSLIFGGQPCYTKEFDFTYYLSNESSEILKKINFLLKSLSDMGYRVCIRKHPRYTEENVFTEIFSQNIENGKIFAEDNKEVNIEKSLLRSNHCVSLFSTVMHQAVLNNVKIVIDDMSNPEFYNKLRSVEFYCLNVPHELLSDILKDETADL